MKRSGGAGADDVVEQTAWSGHADDFELNAPDGEAIPRLSGNRAFIECDVPTGRGGVNRAPKDFTGFGQRFQRLHTDMAMAGAMIPIPKKAFPCFGQHLRD